MTSSKSATTGEKQRPRLTIFGAAQSGCGLDLDGKNIGVRMSRDFAEKLCATLNPHLQAIPSSSACDQQFPNKLRQHHIDLLAGGTNVSELRQDLSRAADFIEIVISAAGGVAGQEKLRILLCRWLDLPNEPTPGEGMVSTMYDGLQHASWLERYRNLRSDTEEALAGVQPQADKKEEQ